MEGIKKIDWKNVLERALWTFVEGFLLTLPVTIPLGASSATWKSILLGALGGGISALKTCIVDLIRQHNEQYKETDIEVYDDEIEPDEYGDLEDVFPEENEESEGDEEK